MTVIEIKSEIKRAIDDLPEGSSFTELLNLINDLKQYPAVDLASVFQIKQIVSENRQLLQKLAE